MATRGALVLAVILLPLLLCLLTVLMEEEGTLVAMEKLFGKTLINLPPAGAAGLYWGSYWRYSQGFLVVLSALTAVGVIACMYIIGQEYRRHLKRASEREKFRRFLEEKRTAMNKYIEELRAIADEVDKFHKGAAIATAVGLAFSPLTLGASLILSAVAGAVTKVVSGVSEVVSNKTDLKKVEKILKSCSKDIGKVFAALEDFENSIMTEEREEDREHLLRELQGIWQEFFNAENAGLCTGNEFNKDTMVFMKDVMRSVMLLIAGLLDDIVQAAAAAAARGGARAAARTAAKATGTAGVLFLPFDAYDIYKNAKDIHRGAKTDLASRIREIVANICSILSEPKHGFLAIKHK